jgi:7,8-dihydroneopterin aldolase/epimerase/oxygenase
MVAKFSPRASASGVQRVTFPPDQVCVEQLEVSARVGVTESERAQPQRLSISLTTSPRRPLVDLGDDIRNTIDYSEVCAEIREFVQNRTDKLIETLADRLAAHLLQRFAMQRITIEIRKFVVPDAKFVAVTLTRVATEG